MKERKMDTVLQRENSGVRNLRPWKPGQSGNPLGRPRKGLSIVELVQQHITLDEVARIIARKLKSGDRHLLKEFWERVDGRPPEKSIIRKDMAELVSEEFTVEEQLRILDNIRKLLGEEYDDKEEKKVESVGTEQKKEKCVY